jgi:hypothetical protein
MPSLTRNRFSFVLATKIVFLILTLCGCCIYANNYDQLDWNDKNIQIQLEKWIENVRETKILAHLQEEEEEEEKYL